MPGIGVCRACGEEIYWFKNQRDRTAPPMTPTTENVNVVIEGVLVTAKRWNKHVCDPDRIARREQDAVRRERQAEEARAQRREAEEERERKRLLWLHQADVFATGAEAREAFRTEQYRLAMLHECPLCRAEVGEPCEHQGFARQNKVQYVKNPHSERLALIPEQDHPFWLSGTEFVAPAQHHKER